MDKIQLAKKLISRNIYKNQSLFKNKILNCLLITSTCNLHHSFGNFSLLVFFVYVWVLFSYINSPTPCEQGLSSIFFVVVAISNLHTIGPH